MSIKTAYYRSPRYFIYQATEKTAFNKCGIKTHWQNEMQVFICYLLTWETHAFSTCKILHFASELYIFRYLYW